MKILFVLIVLTAIAYLAIPQVAVDKFKTYLPQQKIEQAAQSLLANVDAKLNSFKQTLSKRQENRISVLEEKISILERKFSQNTTGLNTPSHNKKSSANSSFNSSVNSVASSLNKPFEHEARELVSTPQLDTHKLDSSNNYDELLSKANTKTALAANHVANNVVTESKTQRMNRQTSLQALAERMNRTSLLALTN